MQLHLFIPSLFWSDTSTPEIYHDLHLNALETLLAKSKAIRTPASDSSTWLCQLFHIDKQLDWPIAPITMQTDHCDSAPDSNAFYWLRADPVHLRIEQNHILLADRHVFEVTQEEALQYTDTINQFFSDDAFNLLPLHPHRWYLRLEEQPEIHTHTLDAVTCKNINNLLPTGKDSVKWRKIFNEIQMLLHDHPLNQTRAAHNQLAVNSIWLWGGGYRPQSVHAPYTALWSNHYLPHALANFCQMPYSPLPDNVANWLQTLHDGSHFVVLDTLTIHDKYNNAYAWREYLQKLETTWFIPIYTALKNDHIDLLKISTTNENATYDFTVTRKSLWKFWSTIQKMSFYAVNR